MPQRADRKPALRDRHRLYELSVQCPEADIRFFDRIYRNTNGRLPASLREDFCGTARLAAQWVRTRKTNVAVGVDLDRDVLAWARTHNVEPLGDAAARLKLVQADVRSFRGPRVDLLAALNFSYFIFKTRRELVRYFRHARSRLAPGGILVLDIFGGWEAQQPLTERKRVEDFTYLWELASFDPITHDVRFHIHFRLRDGGWIRRAFTYDWRFWTIPEVREALHEAGFGTSEVYWEGTERETGEGDGVFRLARRASQCPGWIAYVVARG